MYPGDTKSVCLCVYFSVVLYATLKSRSRMCICIHAGESTYPMSMAEFVLKSKWNRFSVLYHYGVPTIEFRVGRYTKFILQ